MIKRTPATVGTGSCTALITAVFTATTGPPAWSDENRPRPFAATPCEGLYRHHLQGICTNRRDAVYWSFTTTLVKTDRTGKVQAKIPVANHHGDLCYLDGKLYVAVNLGRFNEPAGQADSWVYVYDAETLKELARHETPEVVHGAGGLATDGRRFIVVGGLPQGVNVNYAYEYDRAFRFVRRHVIDSGYTLLGIQTAAWSEGTWWFGCYGSPAQLLRTNDDFKLLGRHTFDCGLGIERRGDRTFLVARGRCDGDKGCTGEVRIAETDRKNGLVLRRRGDVADR